MVDGVGDSVVFAVTIPATVWRRYYGGSVRTVRVTAEDGRTVAFPAGVLQRFVGADGVYGRFRLEFDGQGRFQGIERLG